MGVHDVDEHPWIAAELETLREVQAREIAIFGVCLGGQLLAAGLGGEVTARDRPEIGYLPLERTTAAYEDPVFAGWPDGATALFLHDDEVVTLPEGAVPMLAGSDGVAAWRAPGGRSYGVQFHPEVDAEQVAAWAEDPANQARFERAGVGREAFIAEARRRDRFHRAAGLALVGRWIDAVVGADDPDPRRSRRARG
jgi:GMP synthase (glutamine-hydrolysing)